MFLFPNRVGGPLLILAKRGRFGLVGGRESFSGGLDRWIFLVEEGGGSVWQTNLQILDLQRLASPILVGKICFYSSLSM